MAFPQNDMQILATLLPAFAESFGGRPRLFRAPGRVNLIGEHTDYTGGLVMPAAIDFSTWVAAGRREDCEAAARIIGPLRDLTMDTFERLASNLPEPVRKGSRHVVSENARVLQAAASLEQGDIKAFGRYMGESHRSLRDDYEVSCRELDIMTELAGKLPGVYGSRITGGGFGGCTISLVESSHVEDFVNQVTSGYARQTGLTPDVYVCRAEEGAKEVPLSEPAVT
jgi:galactokinase